jgi:hypothetical protein
VSAIIANEAHLSALVDALEAIPVDVGCAELDALVDGLARRQTILDRLQEADTSALDPNARRLLRARLAAVQSRDAELLAALVGQHAEIAEALGESGRARSAARGYRGALDAAESATRRTA